MGHAIQAVVGPIASVEEFASAWQNARVVQRPQGMALAFLTNALIDEIAEKSPSGDADPFDEFEFLSAPVAAVIAASSRGSMLAYVETEYFGGMGGQAAVLFADGRVSQGPFHHDTGSGSQPPGPGAINTVLRAMGVAKARGSDEFDGLGLGEFRHMPEDD